MDSYRLTCTFDVIRRIEFEGEELDLHLDAVMERLHGAQSVREVETEADLNTGRTTLSITVSTLDSDPSHHAAVILATAIRSCGGVHHGLLSMAEEGTFRAGRNQWSGLRTPSWTIRERLFEDHTQQSLLKPADS